jgi:hypothetical protein
MLAFTCAQSRRRRELLHDQAPPRPGYASPGAARRQQFLTAKQKYVGIGRALNASIGCGHQHVVQTPLICFRRGQYLLKTIAVLDPRQ